jgi:hypothetical protein
MNLELDLFQPGRDALRAAADTAYESMNPDQGRTFDTMKTQLAVSSSSTGRGKTFLMVAICDWIRGDGVIVCVVGTTAPSVIHYERGRTSHSAFGIPVQRSDEGLKSWERPC